MAVAVHGKGSAAPLAVMAVTDMEKKVALGHLHRASSLLLVSTSEDQRNVENLDITWLLGP